MNKFLTMLRKMWTGQKVQESLDSDLQIAKLNQYVTFLRDELARGDNEITDYEELAQKVINIQNPEDVVKARNLAMKLLGKEQEEKNEKNNLN